MPLTQYPYRVFSLNEELKEWSCLICGSRVSVGNGIGGAGTRWGVKKAHTILKCAENFADRSGGIENACRRFSEILKSRDKIDEVIAAFRAAVIPYRMLPVPDTTAGSRELTGIGEDSPVRKPHQIFNPVGCSVAKYFTLGDGRKQLFLGKVDEIVIAPVRNADRVLV